MPPVTPQRSNGLPVRPPGKRPRDPGLRRNRHAPPRLLQKPDLLTPESPQTQSRRKKTVADRPNRARSVVPERGMQRRPTRPTLLSVKPRFSAAAGLTLAII